MQQLKTKPRVIIAFILSLIITGIYFVFVYERIPFIYDINDDVAMRNVAAGVITGTPDAHLIFVKYVLGLLISGLYRWFPGLDWYGLVMIGIILFSFSMILYRGLVAVKPVLWKIGYTVIALLLFTCIGLQHIAAFQWTVSAAIAGAAGIYLFYTSETEDRFQTIWEEGIAVFLLLLCLAVRRSVFFMMIPIAGLCFWWKYGSFVKGKKCPILVKHIAVPAVLLAGVVLIIGVERYAYRSDEWKEFLSFNVDRSEIMDYYGLRNYEDNSEFYDSLGLSPEEVENLQRYSLYLTEDIYGEKMHALAVNAEEEYLQANSFIDRVWTGIQKIYEHLVKESYAPIHIFSFCLTAVVLGICWGKNKKQFLLGAAINAVLMVFWLYLGYGGRIVERVGYSMYFLAFFSMLAVGYRTLFLEEKEVVNKVFSGGLTALLCLILLFISGIQWNAIKENCGWRSNYNMEFLDVNRYMAEHPENVYFMTTFSIETYTDNFTVKRDFDFSNLLSVGGWHTFSPLENEKNEKLGITEPKRDIVEKENVYVISLENVNLRYIDRYYEKLYGEAYLGRERVDALDYGERVFEVYDFAAKELGE